MSSELIIILGLALVIVSLTRSSAVNDIIAHWHHRFESVPFSSQEFYAAVEAELERHDVKLSCSRVHHHVKGILSPKREYLRIKCGELVYDVCAAPLGSGYFVSWWLGDTGNAMNDFFVNLPLIGKLFNKRKKTIFEMDTEMMLKEIVSTSIRKSIETLSEEKGERVTAIDWKFQDTLPVPSV